MKLAVVGLCLLGLLAAACAAVLVNGLRVTGVATAPAAGTTAVDDNPEIRVLYATRNVPTMTVVDGSMVTAQLMHRKDAPPGYITEPVDVVGKVVADPLAAGQPFIKTAFADVTRPKQLAAIIPKGKRAVSISVTDFAGLEGLLYPGSMVDVMVSFKAADLGAARREALTTTLIQNIQVLALDQQTVLTPGKMIDDITSGHSNAARRVTLLVDTKQAKVLELAMDQGTLSLALRNPLDGAETDKEIVSVHSIMGDDPPIALRPNTGESGFEGSNPLQTVLAALVARDFGMGELHNNLGNSAAPNPQQPAAAPKPPHWDITVIQGNVAETQSFPMPPGSVAVGDQIAK